MNGMVVYLLKSACWLTGFALIYLIFLRNERFFLLKRIFLISGILISFLFPLISFHYKVILPMPDSSSFNAVERVTHVQYDNENGNTQRNFNYQLVLLLAYFAGMIFIAVKMLLNLSEVWKSARKSKISSSGETSIIRSPEYTSSFTFFNYIFINPSVEENELPEIMNHELVHVRQMHWIDLVLCELIRLVQWVNPLAWLYTRFIRINHEHLADEAALEHSSNPAIYKAALLNQMFSSSVISLSNSFNYNLNNNRFEMMKKIITSPYRKLKVLCVLPVFAIIFYAFAEPEIRFEVPANVTEEESVMSSGNGLTASPEQPLTIAAEQIVKDVKGVVQREDGSVFPNVPILVTGTQIRAVTDASGNFTLKDVPEESMIVFSYRGYLTQVVKPRFNETMTIKLEKDPEFRPSPGTVSRPQTSLDSALVVIDGEISEKSGRDAMRETSSDQIASVSILKGDKAVEKYGEKGKKGVVEIMTKKKAAELGIKVPFRRTKPDDFPTFRGNGSFGEWVREHTQYPAEAAANGIAGRVTANFTVEADGKISNMKTTGNQVLADAVAKAIKEAPQWEPAKNPEGQTPFSSSVSIEFRLPDMVQIAEVPFVVVEEMPMYPGGDQALLDFLRNNLVYPQEAKDKKIEGRVIIRFAVMSDGSVDNISVLKGVDPLLDAEAVKLVSKLKNFSPGKQGGKAVPVWYMVPVTFTLPKDNEQKDSGQDQQQRSESQFSQASKE